MLTSGKTNGGAGRDSDHNGLGTEELLRALAAPFLESLVGWVVMATRQSERGKQGLMVPYADPRAYTDRLNSLVTAAGWTREYTVEVVHGFERTKKGADHRLVAAKVLVVCKLTIFGLGTHAGTGEAWADEENAMTAAEAQAFKRTCSCFGLGRYFYDISGCWVELDELGRPLSRPNLPDWARYDGGSAQKAGMTRRRTPDVNGKSQNLGARSTTPKPASGGKQTHRSFTGAPGATNGQKQSLVRDIEHLRQLVGETLSANIVTAVMGTQDIATSTDAGKLALVRERLANVSRGIDRLRKAIEASGLERYSQVCMEIGFAGGLNEVPDTKVLRRLVERLEAASPPATDGSLTAVEPAGGTSSRLPMG